MAMNKRERAQMQTLRERLALRWDTFTDEDIARDVLPPTSASPLGEESSGWDFNHHNTATPAKRAWSSSVYHGWGESRGQHGGSQQSRALYSTESRALKAARRAMTEDFAAKLAALDDKIADAIEREKGEGR